jgi:16S rRNA (guanine966-N2)-methyltransferase
MRIVGGTLRGRILVAPKGQSTRPTADRTRQALFNVLEHAAWSPGIAGLKIADLFAGTGALGLEALSRGAASCIFVEDNAVAKEGLVRNIQNLRCDDQAVVWARNAALLPSRSSEGAAPFDLAFLDPPYGMGLAEGALANLIRGDWVNPGGIVVVERGAGETASGGQGLDVLDERVWGAAKITILKAA